MSEIHKHIDSLINSKNISGENISRIMQIILMGGTSSIQISAISAILQSKKISHTELYNITVAMKKKNTRHLRT